MLAFPEYFVGISTANLFSACMNNIHLKSLAAEDGVPWSLTHTVLVNIGGIAIRFPEEASLGGLPSQSPPGRTNGITPIPASGDKDAPYNSTTFSMEHDSVRQLERARAISQVCAISTDLAEQDSQSTVNDPTFLHEFEQRQQRHLRGNGNIPWKPFVPHVSLAANARPRRSWIQENRKKYCREQLAPLQGDVWVLDSKQLILARKHKIIERLRSLDVEEIEDKSKIDVFLRILAVVQVLWFAIELMARKVLQVPSSALEISTVAFVACALLLYIIEWPKSKDVSVPFYVPATSLVTPTAFILIAEASPITFLQPRYYYMPQSSVHQVLEGRFKKEHVDRLVVLVSILSIGVYGGIHFFAWNLAFPTPIEKLLWRVSALTVTIAPAISALLVFLEDITIHRTDQLSKWSVAILAPAYLASRMYIVVESFRSLYYLPPEAFVATWVSNAPHFG